MLNLIDRVLMIRTEEAMRDFNWRESQADRRKGKHLCPVPGCNASTRGGRCKKHRGARFKSHDRRAIRG